jgi:Glycosyl hydrolase family 47
MSHAPGVQPKGFDWSVSHVQGLIPTTINRQSGTGGATFSVGAAADSYYEYLLKLWLLGGQKVSLHHPVGNKDAEAPGPIVW